jgi:hypothetical protein
LQLPIIPKDQEFDEAMVPLDLGRTLVHRAAHRLIADPLEQELRAHGLALLLQRLRKAVAGAVAVDAGQHRRGGQGAALDRNAKLHELRVVFPNQLPVHGAAEEGLDAGVALRGIGPIQLELAPATNPWHQLNAEQIREPEEPVRLAVGIGMDLLGVEVGEVKQERIEDIGCFVSPTRNESAEERDVVIGNVPVRDAAGLTIADVVLGQQIVLEGFKVGAISHRSLAAPPCPRQLKLSIEVDQIG